MIYYGNYVILTFGREHIIVINLIRETIMKKYIISAIVTVMLVVTVFSVYASSGESYIEKFFEDNASEIELLPTTIVGEFFIGEATEELLPEEDNYDPKHNIRLYTFDINAKETYQNRANESVSFDDLISEDYFYVYYLPEFNKEALIANNEGTDGWEHIGNKASIRVIRDKFPEFNKGFAGMIDYIAAEHPDFDYESVKLLDGNYFVNSYFLRFTEHGKEYAAVFYYDDDAFEIENGSILTTEELFEQIDKNGYLEIKESSHGEEVDGDLKVTPKENGVIGYLILTVGIVVILALIAFTVVKKRKTR